MNLIRDHLERAAQHLANVTLTGLSPSITLAPAYMPLHMSVKTALLQSRLRMDPMHGHRDSAAQHHASVTLSSMSPSTTSALTCMPSQISDTVGLICCAPCCTLPSSTPQLVHVGRTIAV